MDLNIRFCVEAGVLDPADRDRLFDKLARTQRVTIMADEFGLPLPDMATACLDGGIAYMRARLLVGDLGGMWFSPAPIPDAGWDCMADDPDEADFYNGFCARLCAALGVASVVIQHVKLAPAQAALAHSMNAIGNVVAAMQSLGIPFVAAHWPATGPVPCNNTLVDVCETQLVPTR